MGAIGARTAFRLAIPAALVAAGAGSVLAAAPATAAARGTAVSSCTVRWVGRDVGRLWTDPNNWSTGKVPGASDNVCITNTNDDVLTPVSITVHSLLLGVAEGIELEGTTSKPVTATVATSITMTPGLSSRIEMTDATIKAAQIISHEGTIFTAGTCKIISPDIVLADGSDLEALNGTVTLTSLSELSNGTLTGVGVGAGVLAGPASVVLPGDITHLASANITLGRDSAIDDPAGHNALSGLTSVDARSSLADANNLTLTGSSFTDDGQVDFGPGTLAIEGPFTQPRGTLDLEPNAVLSASPVTIDRGASFFDQGTVATDLVNDGSVVAVGTAHVTQNYTQAPGASLTSGFGNLLTVAGTARLAGSVSATKVLAQTGDETQLITFGSLAGNFTGHSLGLKLLTRFNEIDGLLLPQIAVSPTTVAPGHTVTMHGGGFTIGQVARIFLDRASGTPLATASIDALGGFTATITIPASAAAGPHRLIAVQSDGNRASASITVR
jgi:hypothetical protein